MTVLVYLAAIVAANLSSAAFGPSASILNAFLFIGLDLTARDKLHDEWQEGRAWKMALLIAAGGLLSYALNAGAAQIAVASSVAFAAAAVVDWVMYTALSRYERLWRVNGSNVVSAAVDSLLFPTLAFGGVLPLITLGQWAAKVAGGYVWSFVLTRRKLGVA
jgi:hypothetical protein